jgi:NADPH:quinone reductase-like Zn-dependent oxidoreductase
VKAAYADRYGPPDVVSIRDLPRPEPVAGEVRVRVHATTVSRTDCGNLRGEPRFARVFTGMFRPKHPVFGLDFAGVVDELGEGVAEFAPGDRVFGIAPGGFGGHAECLCMRADGSIAPLPERVAFAEAVVCEGVWYAKTYLNAFDLGPGQRLMVYGASGAIGTAAVQLAKARGAEVTAVVDTRHMELALSLGADRVVDYTAEDFTRVDDSLDFLLDAVGKANLYEARRLLKPGGIYSATDFGPRNQNLMLLLMSPLMRDRRFVFPLPGQPRAAVETAATLLATGELRAVVDRILPLEEIGDAYRYVETGNKTGIVVIEVTPEAG